jgi:hypothetical protein
MTQPAWPSTEWNFLGHDYDTQSSFYGTQKACEPVHAQLNLEDGSVDLINLNQARSLKVRVRVLSLDGKTLSDKTNQIEAAADARTPVTKLDLDQLAGGHTVLVKLNVDDPGGTPISDNFYWWAKQDSSLQELNQLPQQNLEAAILSLAPGENGERVMQVQLRNSGSVPALMIKLTLIEKKSDERVLPAYYSENYVSLLPGEERVVTIHYPSTSLKSGSTTAGPWNPRVALRGWNIAPMIRPAE